jgi:hypothetical protein
MIYWKRPALAMNQTIHPVLPEKKVDMAAGNDYKNQFGEIFESVH